MAVSRLLTGVVVERFKLKIKTEVVVEFPYLLGD